jgi:hypothetical protein
MANGTRRTTDEEGIEGVSRCMRVREQSDEDDGRGVRIDAELSPKEQPHRFLSRKH